MTLTWLSYYRITVNFLMNTFIGYNDSVTYFQLFDFIYPYTVELGYNVIKGT
jgi:hypothetical protein